MNIQRTYRRALAWTGAAALAATAAAGCVKQGDAPAPDTYAYEYEEQDESVIDVVTQGLDPTYEYTLPAAFPAPAGDAFTGLKKIMEGDIMTCGFPYTAYTDLFVGPIVRSSFTQGRGQDRTLGDATTSLTFDTNTSIKNYVRNSDNRYLPYNITRFRSIDRPPAWSPPSLFFPFGNPGGDLNNGLEVVNMNCFTCHAGYLPQKATPSSPVAPMLTIGVGDVARDFTNGFWPGLSPEMIGPPTTLFAAFFALPQTMNQIGKMTRNMLVWGSELNMNTVGINVANQLGMFLAKHHKSNLEFSSAVLNPSYYYFDTDPATNDRVPDSEAHLAVDPAPWWRVKKKTALFYNASTRGFHHGSMALASSICVDNPETAKYVTDQFPHVQAFVESRTAPKYPWTIDSAKANAGKVIFNEKCAACHGTYATATSDALSARVPANDTFPNKLIREGHVGTDPAWARAGWYGNMEVMNKGVNSTAYANVTALTPWIGKGLTPYNTDHFSSDTWNGTTWVSQRAPLDNTADNPSTTNTVEGTRENVPFPGYIAAPLDGIWASAPYFHNGSVPDLMGVIDAATRPTYWKRSCNLGGSDSDRKACAMAYDQTKAGWIYTNPGPQDLPANLFQRKYIYDTTKWSQGNEGHLYSEGEYSPGVPWDATKRAQLIEYLKTL